jgi:hypothetical protein
MKHRITLSDEEIEILLEAIESADWYCDEDCEEFWKKLELLKKKLENALDFNMQEKRRRAGRIAWEKRRLRERVRKKLLKGLYEERDG